jgi:hypothetical protein
MVLALLAIMSGMVAATETRQATFGPASMFISDYTDIYFLPANAVSYPRMVGAEMGSSFPVVSDYGWSEGSAAMLFSNAEQTFGVVGFDINHAIEGSDFLTNAIANVNASPFGMGIPTPDNRFHLFYAKKLNSLTAGLHIAWAGASSTNDVTDTNNAYTGKYEGSSNIWFINGEVMMEVNENTSAELAIGIMMQSFKGEAAESWRDPTIPPAPGANYTYTVESDGGMGLDLELRAEYGMSDNLKLIPIIGFGTNSIEYKDGLAATGVTYVPSGGKVSTSNFGGAFGANYKPAENVTIVGGLFMGSDKETIEDTNAVFGTGIMKEETSHFTFPGFCAGLEVDLLKWLTLRAGAAKTLISTTTLDETNATKDESTYTSAPYFYAFGLGFKFGKLAIDAKVNNNAPYSLGYMFSGIDNGGMAGVSHTEPITSIGMTFNF